MLSKFFKFDERKTNTKQEVLAGITTFLSMAYIIGVNPVMLSKAGMPFSGVFFATIISAAIASILMGVFANYPVGSAPVMGLNALFTYTIVIYLGNTWECAVAAIFLSSIIFLIINISGLRDKILHALPNDLKYGITAAIGFYLAFIGFRFANIIVLDSTTLTAMGDLFQPSTFLALNGIFITAILFVKKVPAGLFISIIVTAILGLIFTFLGFGVSDPLMPTLPTEFISFEFDLSLFGGFLRGFEQLFSNIKNLVIILFSLVFVLFFDTVGTVMSLSQLCGLTDENGEITDFGKILVVDGIGGVIGAVFGTSTVSIFLESATGIETGGKTGLTAITVGICFLISIFFYPIIVSLFTTPVIASALILVGILMVNQLEKVNLTHPVIGTSVFFTIIMMVLTNSISFGIAWGFSFFSVLEIITGKINELNPGMIILCITFILYLFFGL